MSKTTTQPPVATTAKPATTPPKKQSSEGNSEAKTVPPADIGAKLFKQAPASPKDCLILIYDFESFTSFLSVPDIHRDVARYLNHVDNHVRWLFHGGVPIDMDKPVDALPLTILHEKFLGDGVMFIVEYQDQGTARSGTSRALCKRMLYLKNQFHLVNKEAMKFMPVADLPQRIRFGLTYGTVLELSRPDGGTEYIGFPINLAARLQKYAGKTSFLASARLPHSDEWMEKFDFVKVKAKALRDRPDEFVYIDKNDLELAKKSGAAGDLFELVKP